jgi:transcriptional regulator with XRE-family HTH domain
MNVQINPAALKAFREKQGLSQEALVRRVQTRAQVSLGKRQIQRIESRASQEGCITVQEKTLRALARALNVSPGTLQAVPDDLPEAEAEVELGQRTELTVKLRTATLTKLDMVRSAYKVELEEIIDLAPLMFVYHAESSLRERRARLEANQRVRDDLLRAFPGLASVLSDDPNTAEESESFSVSVDDVFGAFINPEGTEGTEADCNPFTQYLMRLSERFGDPSTLDVVDEGAGQASARGVSRLPDYTVCGGFFDQLTGGDADLKNAIRERRLLIDSIPWHVLMQKEDLRIIWLRRELERLQEDGSEPGLAGERV